MRDKVILSWSGGKDAALAFRELQRREQYELIALLTVVTEEYDRISMHGVPRVLLHRQADSLGLPLETISISKSASNEGYERAMRELLEKYLTLGVSSVAFGDIFLEDVRSYREHNLAKVGMKAVFPLWQRDTGPLAQTFIDLGFEAVVTCVDSSMLDGSFAGRDFDERFLSDLPVHVDPCGENGEFHTFVYAGPIFTDSIPLEKGEVVLRDDRFYYCDLLSA
ncbi:MAG: diphthine--ammonia ligase [Anaerolineae bacterium]|nr:diphthine--ammonia ligase [Anaerolineae bacterium]NIN98875.1 diphthine--ammonia ligase [Anaerolineae bacterium]NIQ81786.1 diphthine--ammonia ligase [Anaerolineae bacterium]